MNKFNHKLYISPSIIAADYSVLKEEIKKIDDAKIDMIHFDVMDNHFVPNLTFGSKLVSDFKKYSKAIFDVHLMITNPEETVQQYIDAGADYITIHIEATEKVNSTLEYIKKKNVKASISVKPKTPIEKVFPYLDILDMILIMSVEPGFAGQKMIESCLNKIPILKEYIVSQNSKCLIEIDGGINVDNIKTVYDLGVDVVVMGSAFFKEPDYCQLVKKINSIIKD